MVERSENLHGFAEDIKDTAAPAAMDGAHDPPPRIEQEHSLTIGVLDHDPDLRQIGDEGIVSVHLKIFFRPAVKAIDPVAMDLPCRDEEVDTHNLLYPSPVDRYRGTRVAHRITAVQRCIGFAADPAMSIEHGESAAGGLFRPEGPAHSFL